MAARVRVLHVHPVRHSADPASERSIMPNPDVEREVTYIGGPWDGQTRWEPKAFWPPANQMVNEAGGITGAWPDAWPADEPRYMPEITDGCEVRMVWAAPNDAHAPVLIPRPESTKYYDDCD